MICVSFVYVIFVFKCECASKYCVIKRFNLSKFPGQIEYVQNEIDVSLSTQYITSFFLKQLKKLSEHRNIVTFYGDILKVFYCNFQLCLLIEILKFNQGGQRYMIMEYAGITIGDLISWKKLKQLVILIF